MIFVSYSNQNKLWRDRWEMMSSPMAKANRMEFWSDKKLQPGELEPQITRAMDKSEAVVLLVSAAFLASDFIMEKEFPYFLRARQKRSLEVFWMLLEPCDLRHYYGRKIRQFVAMTRDGSLKPLSEMKDAEWQHTMVKGCEMIDDYLRQKEKPKIHPLAKSRPKLKRITQDFQLLETPPRRRVEVLLYAGGKWWKQGSIEPGSTKIRIALGDEKTPSGREFRLVAITTDEPLTESTYPNLPDFRTMQEIILRRA